LIVESLNGYRLKETQPDNLGEYSIPLGVPEILQEGEDVSLVTYGSVIREAMEAVEMLSQVGIRVEVIDVQTLIPFDRNKMILESIKKTNKVVVLDEDVPGGGSAYILQKILEEQNAWDYLDAKPLTITAEAHRPPYGSDGDYFSKPNAEDIYECIAKMMKEYDPQRF
jgi:pyruvate/2-oxoglutarate/acetoin dehydrogenase E1 component